MNFTNNKSCGLLEYLRNTFNGLLFFLLCIKWNLLIVSDARRSRERARLQPPHTAAFTPTTFSPLLSLLRWQIFIFRPTPLSFLRTTFFTSRSAHSKLCVLRVWCQRSVKSTPIGLLLRQSGERTVLSFYNYIETTSRRQSYKSTRWVLLSFVYRDLVGNWSFNVCRLLIEESISQKSYKQNLYSGASPVDSNPSDDSIPDLNFKLRLWISSNTSP